eukprot:1031289-Pyramimonas_sp.AAC.1
MVYVRVEPRSRGARMCDLPNNTHVVQCTCALPPMPAAVWKGLGKKLAPALLTRISRGSSKARYHSATCRTDACVADPTQSGGGESDDPPIR